MKPREIVFRVIYLALLEIREASSPGNVIDDNLRKKIFYLSDLVHSAPLALLADEERGGDGSSVLDAVRRRAVEQGVERWLDNAIAQVPGSLSGCWADAASDVLAVDVEDVDSVGRVCRPVVGNRGVGEPGRWRKCVSAMVAIAFVPIPRKWMDCGRTVIHCQEPSGESHHYFL